MTSRLLSGPITSPFRSMPGITRRPPGSSGLRGSRRMSSSRLKATSWNGASGHSPLPSTSSGSVGSPPSRGDNHRPLTPKARAARPRASSIPAGQVAGTRVHLDNPTSDRRAGKAGLLQRSTRPGLHRVIRRLRGAPDMGRRDHRSLLLQTSLVGGRILGLPAPRVSRSRRLGARRRFRTRGLAGRRRGVGRRRVRCKVRPRVAWLQLEAKPLRWGWTATALSSWLRTAVGSKALTRPA